MYSFCQAFLNKAWRKKKTKDLQLSNKTISLEHKVSLIASKSDRFRILPATEKVTWCKEDSQLIFGVDSSHRTFKVIFFKVLSLCRILSSIMYTLVSFTSVKVLCQRRQAWLLSEKGAGDSGSRTGLPLVFACLLGFNVQARPSHIPGKCSTPLARVFWGRVSFSCSRS